MRIGLFGGSFDPFHLGHFLVARTAHERFRLHKVVFLPCAQSPLKSARPTAPDQARLRMLTRGLRRQGWAEISDYEIRKGGASYTIETVRTWNQIAPRTDLFWIMGSDQWKMLPTWKEPRELGEKLRFLVFPRPERPRPLKGFEMMEIPLRIDISATEIRQRIRKKLSLEGLLLPGVEFLVQKHRWYG